MTTRATRAFDLEDHRRQRRANTMAPFAESASARTAEAALAWR